ncbi:MAG TPA: pilin [Candidatus Paceibacterota bacterium]|nr:pilin [Candidatus Paceibacterota bacterium]
MKALSIIFSVAALMAAVTVPGSVRAAAISVSLPSINGATDSCANPNSSDCNPGSFIKSFYQFALAIGGLAAFGAMVFGGIKYMSSGGNPSMQSEAKEWLWGAILGVALLAGAYLILSTIDPALTTLNLPSLQGISTSGNQQGGGCSAACPQGTVCTNGSCENAAGAVFCGGRSTGQCPQGQICANDGDYAHPSYACHSTNPADYTCGGDPPNSHYGTCAPNLHCVNVATQGTTPQTVHYLCQ